MTLSSSNNSNNNYAKNAINNRKVLATAFQNTTIINNNNNNINNATSLSNNNNQRPLNEKKELIEINNRLGNYINSVKDLSQNIRLTQATQHQTVENNYDFGGSTLNINNSTTGASNTGNSASYGNTLLISMKNLEKDLAAFKQLYEDEFKQMRAEIEELSLFKNKYSLENYNLQIKLEDFIVKFEDVKRMNQDLLQELNEVKSKNNQIEFETETSKLDADKSQRENKQLKKDLQDLIEKLNEKQAISDNEIACRQEIETKYKELADMSSFQKKIHEQELENFKSQLKVSHEAISNLEIKLDEMNQNEVNLTKNFNVEYQQLENECNNVKNHNAQLEEQNETLKATCQNLESVIRNLEEIKSTLEEKLALKNNNKYNTPENMNIPKPITLNDKSRQYQQSRMSFNTNFLDLNDQTTKDNQNTCIKFSDVNEYFTDDTGTYEQEEDKLFTSINLTGVSDANLQLTRPASANQNLLQQKLSNNQFIQSQQEQQQLEKQNQQLSQMKKKQLLINDQQKLTFLPNNSVSSPNIFSPSSSSSISSPNSTKVKNQKPLIQNQNLVVGGQINSLSYLENKDFTNDLFKNFEKNTLLLNSSRRADLKSNSQMSNIDNNVTEASYIGNVKIHEVNKNGYYIRLLNVSNTIDEDLSNYTIQQVVSTMPVAVYRLPPATKLLPGHTLTVWSRTDEVQPQPPHTYVWQEQDRWGTGPECTTILSKPNGQAISWTTGCHKYGNIDYDEIVPVYTQRRQKAQQILLNREKLLPQSVFMPTKHPHAQAHFKSTDTIPSISSSAMSSFATTTKENNNNLISSSSKLLQSDCSFNQNNYSAFQKSFFTTNTNQRTNAVKPAIANNSNSNSSKLILGVK